MTPQLPLKTSHVSAFSWPVRLLLLASSIVVALLLLEGVLRVFQFRFDALVYEKDATLGWKLRPGTQGWEVSEGEAYLRINSWGQRDVERSVAKPLNTYRIAVLGDSMVESQQVPIEDTFCAIMEKSMPHCPAIAGRRVEVLNFGVNGYGTAQELLLLENRVWQFRPDTVVLAIYFGNDLFDNHPKLDYAAPGLRPYFVFRGGELALDDSFRMDKSFRPASILRHRITSEVINHSRLLQLVSSITAAMYAKQVEKRQQNAGGGVAANYVSTWPFLPPKHPYMTESWRATEAMLLKCRDEVGAHGADFVLMSMPMPRQINPNISVREAFLRETGAKDLYYADNRLKTFAEQNRIPLLLLSGPLGERALREKVYLNGFKNTAPGEGHLNVRGHQAVAELLTQFLCGRLQGPASAPR